MGSSDMTPHIRRGGARESPATRRFRRGFQERITTTNSDVRLTLPARSENIAVIRHVLGAFGEALRLPPDLIEDVRLAVTEACTNVVRHAYDGDEPGPIDVVVHPEGERLEVVVTDRGRGMGPSPDVDGPGLGLPLIAALSDSVEIQETPIGGNRLTMSFACRPRLGVA
jgi:anti-sigma regulatory factor (Ser/Thr protein kinase)